MTNPSVSDRNKQFVIDHFNDLVNKKDLDAITRNFSADFVDHDGPGGKPGGRDDTRSAMETLFANAPDVRVEVRDALSDEDKVVARNVWTGTNSQTGQRFEIHGFVLWRFSEGKFVERWAVVTPPAALIGETLEW